MDLLTAAAALNPNAKWALSAGKRLAANKDAQAAAKIIQRLAKSKFKRGVAQQRRRSQVGERPGSSLSKHVQYRTDGYTTYNSHTLNAVELLQIPRISSTFSLGSRLRDIVYLSGFKVCLHFKHLSADTKPLYVNLALVSAKNRGAVDGTDLFRSYEGTSRQIDFSNGTLNALDRHCLPINEDEFHVHFHKRVKVHPESFNIAEGHNRFGRFWSHEQYVSIKRQIRFEGAAGDSETKFSLLHWVGGEGDTIAASQIPVSDAYAIDLKVLSVFKEPQPVVRWK